MALPKSNSIVQDGTLSYVNRGVENLNEVIELYSDDELDYVDELNLSKNKIKSLKGVSKFSASRIDLRQNELTLIDDFPNIDDNNDYLELDLSNNPNLKGFTEELINELNTKNHVIRSININISGANNFDYTTLGKLNFKKILTKPDFSNSNFMIDCSIEANEIPIELKDKGFTKLKLDNGVIRWILLLENTKLNNETQQTEKATIDEKPKTQNETSYESFSGVLNNLSTLNWIHIIAPYIFAIIAYGLGKKWEYSGTNFGECLAVSCLFVIFISFFQFMDTREKTGRSFESSHGRLEEYRTVSGDANVSNYFWKINGFHIFVMLFSFHNS